MKKTLLFLVVLLLISGAALYFAAPQIVKVIEEKINQTLSESGMELKYTGVRPGFDGGWSAEVLNPEFRADQETQMVYFKAESVKVSFPLIPFTGKTFTVNKIKAVSPFVRLEMKEAGSASSEKSEQTQQPTGKPYPPVEIMIQEAVIEDGSLQYQNVEGNSLAADQLNLKIQDPMVVKQLSAKGSVRLAGPEQNISIDLRMTRNEKGEYRIQKSMIELNMTQLRESVLIDVFADTSSFPLTELEGKAIWDIHDLILSEAGWQEGIQRIRLEDSNFYLNSHPEALKSVNLKFAQDGAAGTLDIDRAEWSGGNLKGKVTTKKQPDESVFAETGFQIDGVLLERALPPKSPRIPYIAGQVFAGFNAAGMAENYEILPYRMEGQGQIAVDNGSVQNLNVLRTVIEKLSSVPAVGQQVLSAIPPRYQSAMQQGYTPFGRIELQVTMREGKFFFNPTPISSNGFSAVIQGWVDIEGNLQCGAYATFDPELSASLMQVAPALQYIASEDGSLGIGMEIFGSTSGVQLKVDLQPILSRAVQRAGVDLLAEAMKRF